jgi:hypothetical protein
MKLAFYKPEKTVTGPAYSPIHKLLATVIVVVLAGYTATVALRSPAEHFSFGIVAVLLLAAMLLGSCYYWFLRSTVTIDEKGIRQTWIVDREVDWGMVHSAKMIGIPYMSWIFPPRLIVRAGNKFNTFHGGTQEVLVEFAKISLAFQAKK